MRLVFWIKQKKCQDPKIGYNVTKGGEDSNTTGGKKLSYEWKKNISKGGIKRYINNPQSKIEISKRVSGKGNPMYGISMKQRLINKYGNEEGIKKYDECRKQWDVLKESNEKLNQMKNNFDDFDYY